MARVRLADPTAAQELASDDKACEARFGRPGQATTASLDFCLQQQDPEVGGLILCSGCIELMADCVY